MKSNWTICLRVYPFPMAYPYLIRTRGHWRRLVKTIGTGKPKYWEQGVAITGIIGVSQLLEGTCLGCPPKSTSMLASWIRVGYALYGSGQVQVESSQVPLYPVLSLST